MTDTSTRPARDTATRWERHSAVQTAAELLLGLSFTAAVAFGGYAAVTGRMVVLSQGAGIVFLVTLTCVLVSWFRAVEREDTAPRATRTTTTATPTPTVDPIAAADQIAAVDRIAAVDAEYRR